MSSVCLYGIIGPPDVAAVTQSVPRSKQLPIRWFKCQGINAELGPCVALCVCVVERVHPNDRGNGDEEDDGICTREVT